MEMADITPTNDNLREITLILIELPERVKKIDLLTRKEILLFIKKEKEVFLKKAVFMLENVQEDYNYPKKYLPSNQLEYWLVNQHQWGYNYYTLTNVEKLIESSFKKRKVEVFKGNGLELFEHLEKEFTDEDGHPVSKYSILFDFLVGKYIVNNASAFIKWVRANRKKELKGAKFERITRNASYDKKKEKYEKYLTSYKSKFLLK